MTIDVFLVHWNRKEAEEHAKNVQDAGWTVEFESEEANAAVERITSLLPEVVVISLAYNPEKSIQTAKTLRSEAATKEIAIFYLDLNPETKKLLLENVRAAYMINWNILNEEIRAHYRRKK